MVVKEVQFLRGKELRTEEIRAPKIQSNYKFSEKEGAKFKMDINPDHPSQIHKAILRRDIDGISIGADVKRENLYCSVDGKNMFGDECEHYIGQKLDDGKVVLMEVDDYSLDELTVTAKQADPEGKINFSELSNNNYDSSITFSLDTYDKEGKLVERGINLQKDIQGESLKNAKKYDRVETNMDGQADVDNDKSSTKSSISETKFNQLVDTVAAIKQSVEASSETSKASNDALAKYLQAQDDKDAEVILRSKQEIVNRITAKSKEFSDEELLKLDLDYLTKLEKAIVPVVKAKVNQTFGEARVPDDDELSGDKLQLSRGDIKAWFRFRLGYKTPEAPKHIQARVRARLDGEVINGEDSFLQYLMDKGENDK